VAKAYMVVTYRKVMKPEKVAEYAKLAGPAVLAAGGRFLVRGEPAKTYELGMKQRTVVVEFDSLDKARACYEGPAYKKALDVLGEGAAERDMRIVEGA